MIYNATNVDAFSFHLCVCMLEKAEECTGWMSCCSSPHRWEEHKQKHHLLCLATAPHLTTTFTLWPLTFDCKQAVLTLWLLLLLFWALTETCVQRTAVILTPFTNINNYFIPIYLAMLGAHINEGIELSILVKYLLFEECGPIYNRFPVLFSVMNASIMSLLWIFSFNFKKKLDQNQYTAVRQQ